MSFVRNLAFFKFHYVSINSKTGCYGHPVWKPFKFHYVSINSDYGCKAIKQIRVFKFHYVSINSNEEMGGEEIRRVFKFHYVSINSIIPECLFLLHLPLNSIMFLLIHLLWLFHNHTNKTLNSIMFLLIQWSVRALWM